MSVAPATGVSPLQESGYGNRRGENSSEVEGVGGGWKVWAALIRKPRCR